MISEWFPQGWANGFSLGYWGLGFLYVWLWADWFSDMLEIYAPGFFGWLRRLLK